MGRHFGKHGSDNYFVLLHGAKTVGKNFLAYPLKIPLQLIKPPRTFKKISYDEQRPVAAPAIRFLFSYAFSFVCYIVF